MPESDSRTAVQIIKEQKFRHFRLRSLKYMVHGDKALEITSLQLNPGLVPWGLCDPSPL